MSDILVWLGVLLFGALIVGLIVLGSRRRARLLGRLAELAQQKGWHFEAGPETGVDCLLRGRPSDPAWELRYTRPVGSDEDGQSTIEFASESTAFPGTVLLYPKPGRMQVAPQLGQLGEAKGIMGTLFNWSMKLMGLDVSESSFHEIGTRAFLEKYLVLAPDADSARRLVGAVETQLLNWSAARTPASLPVVVVNPDGVRVRVVRDGIPLDGQVQIAEQLANLGLSAVRAFQ